MTWHKHWLQPLQLHRTTHKAELVCVLFAAGPGGHGAGMRPLSDTANMGGGAVKTGSSKSHAQSLKDKKFG